MKQIRKSWEKRYKSLKLFKDDIEKIINIITTEFTETERTIVIDEFELNKLEELSEINKDVVNNFKIFVATASLQLNLDCSCAYLIVDNENDTRLVGIASRIDEVLQKRQRFIGFAYGWIGVALIGQIGFFLTNAFLTATIVSVSLAVASLIICFVTIMSWSYIIRHVSTIHMCYSYKKSNFFKRNKDRILVGVIVSIVSLILGIFGTLVVQWVIRNLNP